MKRFLALAGITVSLLAATVAHAQQPTLPKLPLGFHLAPGGDIPTDHWAYVELDALEFREGLRLAKASIIIHSKRALSRAQFAARIVNGLHPIDSTLEQESQEEPRFWRALSRLVQEFAPELRAQGVDIDALTQRLARIGRTLVTTKADYAFGDVPENHWAYPAVERLRQAGILVGYHNGNYRTY